MSTSQVQIVPGRTFDPKFPHFHSDGTGRDSYIVNNNGGLSIPKMWNQRDSHTMLFASTTRFHRRESPSPMKEAKPFEYRSDGSGRDSYILANSGGLKNKAFTLTGDKFFKATLRSSDHQPYRSPMPSNASGSQMMNGTMRSTSMYDKAAADITSYLNWYTPQAQQQMSVQAKKQRELINRLSPGRGNSKMNSTMNQSAVDQQQMAKSIGSNKANPFQQNQRKSISVMQNGGTI
eukprot:403377469